MLKSFNWKLFGFLVAGCVITGFMVLPFTFALINVPSAVPMHILVIAQMVQLAIIAAAANFIGITLSEGAGLPGMPILEEYLNNKTISPRLSGVVKESVLWGAISGIIVVLLSIPFWDMSVSLMKQEMAVATWKGILSCFYGGFTEEVMFRFAMMTFFVWILKKCRLKNSAFWIGIIVTGVIFGLGHIGITGAMTEITFDVILRAVLLNGSISIIYGVLYWKRGLESAMIAHFTTDVILHVIIPHIIAPILM